MNERDIFLMALEIEQPAERKQFLDTACSGNPQLRERIDHLLRVEHLLRSANISEEIMELPASGLADALQHHDQDILADSGALKPATNLEALVLGDFRLIRQIGRGGMGVVYEAEQISLERRVALKVLPFAAVLDQQQLQRFKTEAKAAAGLHHGNIVPVIQVGCERAVHFYAMQYIDGQNVSELISQLRELAELDKLESSATDAADFRLAGSVVSGHFEPPDETRRLTPGEVDTVFSHASSPQKPSVEIATHAFESLSTKASLSRPEYFRTIVGLGIQASDALQYAHSHGILHRDIKPSNLMLDAEGRLWITDFGLARVDGDVGLTTTGDILGTLRYMSPEQASGTQTTIDHRCDIYSLGVTLYEMLSLTPIFPTTEWTDLLQKRSQEEPVRLRQVNSAIPADLETIVHKAIAREPEARYGTAQELADDLRRFLQHEPIHAKRPSRFVRSLKWARRHRTVTTLMSTVVLTLLVAVAVSVYAATQARRHSTALANIMADLEVERDRVTDSLKTTEKARDLAQTERQNALGQKRTALQTSYRSDMKVAFDRFNDGRLMEAKGYLDRQIPSEGDEDFRGIEWNYLNSKISPRMTLIAVHEGGVNCLAVFPDQQRIATTGDRGFIRIWDVTTGDLLRSFHVHHRRIFSIAISPDGQWLAYGEEDYPHNSHVVIIDPDSGAELGRLNEHPTTIRSMAFSPDGRYLLSGSANSEIRLWEFSDGISGHSEVIYPQLEQATNADLGFVDDGGTLLLSNSNNKGFTSWDLATRSLQREFVNSRRAPVRSFAANSQSRLAASLYVGKTADAKSTYLLGIVDFDKGDLLAEIDARGKNKVCFSLDGRHIFVGSLQGWIAVHTLNESGPSPSRKVTVTLSSYARIANGSIESMVMLDNQRVLCAGSDGRIVLFDTSPQQATQQKNLLGTGRTIAAAVSLDRTRIAFSAANRRVYLTDYANGALLAQTKKKYSTAATSVVWSTDGRHVAAMSNDGLFRCWNVEHDTFSLIAEGKYSKRSTAYGSKQIAFDQTLDPIFTVGNEIDNVYVWDKNNTERPQSIITDTQCAELLVTPDERLLITANDDIRVYDRESLSFVHRLAMGERIHEIAVTPDSQTLVSAHLDGRIHLWNLKTGTLIRSLDAHLFPVHALALSDSGNKLISGDDGGTIHFWDTRSGDHLGSVREFPNASDMILELWLGPGDRWLDVIVGKYLGQRRLERIPLP